MTGSKHIASSATWKGVSGNMGRRGRGRRLPEEPKWTPMDRYVQTTFLAAVALMAFIFTPIPMVAPTRNLQALNAEEKFVTSMLTKNVLRNSTTSVRYHSKHMKKHTANGGAMFHSRKKQKRTEVVLAAVASDHQPAQRPNRSILVDKSQPQPQPISKEKKRRIPKVLLAGTQKAGTSSLAVYLLNLPNTCFSDKSNDSAIGGSLGKESHFFDARHKEGLRAYQDLYQHCSDTDLLIDGTPETMLFPDRVRATYDEQGSADDVKIIFILREPVAREISWYNHRLRYAKLPTNDRPAWANDVWSKDGRRIKTFLQAQEFLFFNLQYRRYDDVYGYYAHWLKKWSGLFDRSRQILVLSYDELNRDPATLLRRVHDFLDLPMPDATASTPSSLTRENASSESRGHATPSPPCTDQRKVARIFKRPNEELDAFMKETPGPSMEQRPFPVFGPFTCRNQQRRRRPRSRKKKSSNRKVKGYR